MAKEENNYGVYRVKYTKADGSSSERDIIKFGEPRDNLLALEVTKLDIVARNELKTFLLDQKAQLQAFMAGKGIEFKSFKADGLEYLDTKAAA